MDNKEILENFYRAFADHDIEKMVSYYDPTIRFFDPAFGLLEGEDVKDMWHMLNERSKGELVVNFKNARADIKKGTISWTAVYNYRLTGREVINNISAEFEFKDGKIISHTDNFDLWSWSRQAFGWKGYLLGWTSFMQNKIRKQTKILLDDYKKKKYVA
jgi:limonene-1,2-epoxide hydrolase